METRRTPETPHRVVSCEVLDFVTMPFARLEASKGVTVASSKFCFVFVLTVFRDGGDAVFSVCFHVLVDAGADAPSRKET